MHSGRAGRLNRLPRPVSVEHVRDIHCWPSARRASRGPALPARQTQIEADRGREQIAAGEVGRGGLPLPLSLDLEINFGSEPWSEGGSRFATK
jgi:hypothetical protein